MVLEKCLVLETRLCPEDTVGSALPPATRHAQPQQVPHHSFISTRTRQCATIKWWVAQIRCDGCNEDWQIGSSDMLLKDILCGCFCALPRCSKLSPLAPATDSLPSPRALLLRSSGIRNCCPNIQGCSRLTAAMCRIPLLFLAPGRPCIHNAWRSVPRSAMRQQGEPPHRLLRAVGGFNEVL